MAPPLARRIAFGGLALVLAAAFLGLGSWQIARRAWKHELLARIDARVHAAPGALPGRDPWPEPSATRDEYLRVRLSGRLEADAQVRVLASTRLGTGVWVLAPLRLADGSAILVNRGFQDTGAPLPPGGEATVTGLLRMPEPRGLPLRPNDPAADRWTSRDVAGICARHHVARCAPWFVDAQGIEGIAEGTAAPVPGLTVLELPDNHLVYAITWFGLAALAIAGLFLFLRPGRLAPGDGNIR